MVEAVEKKLELPPPEAAQRRMDCRPGPHITAGGRSGWWCGIGTPRREGSKIMNYSCAEKTKNEECGDNDPYSRYKFYTYNH